MRPLLAIAATALIVPATALAATLAPAAPKLSVTAWADSVLKNGLPPKDAVREGTLCKPVAFRKLYAFVTFRGLKNKVPSTATWYFGDKRVFAFAFGWEDGASGRTAFSLFPAKGRLEPGRYTVELRWGGKLIGSGGVTLKFGDC